MATIIPFRPRRVEDSSVAGNAASDPAQERLTLALADLETALAAQRLAMAGFREALSDLDQAVGGLSHGVLSYGKRLGGLQADVERLNRDSRALEAWADSQLCQTPLR